MQAQTNTHTHTHTVRQTQRKRDRDRDRERDREGKRDRPVAQPPVVSTLRGALKTPWTVARLRDRERERGKEGGRERERGREGPAGAMSRRVCGAGRVENAVQTQSVALQNLIVVVEGCEALLAEVVVVRAA